MAEQGSAFGKYFLLKKLATGGMGEIFLAKLAGPVGFEKLLVIKRILAEHAQNQAFLDMFFAEARVAATLSHANIVQVYEMGEIEGAYFIAMEYVHGKTLRDIMSRARTLGEYIHPGHVVEIISCLAAGMSYAHSARGQSGAPLGIVHRDLNPHNLLVSYGGEIKIIDFGIAKSEIAGHAPDAEGAIKGKVVYMSPEQSTGGKLDRRSDVFAIGICLYEALTFTNPFVKQNVVMSMDAIQRLNPTPVGQINPRLKAFEPILARALAKNRNDRYSDCGELRTDLQALVQTGSVAQAMQPLADAMRDLFESQIADENRVLLKATKSAQAEKRRAELTGDHEVQGRTFDLGERATSRSRRAFMSFMALIVLVTFWGALGAHRLALQAREALAIPVVVPAVATAEVPKPIARDDYGTLIISTTPTVVMRYRGAVIQGAVSLGKKSSGIFIIGPRKRMKSALISVQLHYAFNDKGITYRVDSKPKALVLGLGDTVYGKTPVSGILGDGLVKLSLLADGGRRMQVTVLYQP